MIKQIIAYLQGRRTPGQLAARSEKHLSAFRKLITGLQKTNETISKEQDHGVVTIAALQAQMTAVKSANAALQGLKDANTKRIEKVTDWLYNE